MTEKTSLTNSPQNKQSCGLGFLLHHPQKCIMKDEKVCCMCLLATSNYQYLHSGHGKLEGLCQIFLREREDEMFSLILSNRVIYQNQKPLQK